MGREEDETISKPAFHSFLVVNLIYLVVLAIIVFSVTMVIGVLSGSNTQQIAETGVGRDMLYFIVAFWAGSVLSDLRKFFTGDVDYVTYKKVVRIERMLREKHKKSKGKV